MWRELSSWFENRRPTMSAASATIPVLDNVVKSDSAPLLPRAIPQFESLNFDRVINHVFIKDQVRQYRAENRHFFGYTGKTATRWVLTVWIGLITAITAKGLIYLIDQLSHFRTKHLDETQSQYEGTPLASLWIFIVYALWNLMLAGCSCMLVLFVSPQAAGSGIPEVKAYLNGTHVPKFLSLNCFLVKLFGSVLSVSSGLVVGPEGPLVHLGAAIGSSVTRGVKNLRFNIMGHKFTKKLRMDALAPFHNDSDRRDFISIGVAAGFAAAFGAPIGGVLFSLEEASSFWSDKLMWRALTAAALSCIILNILENKSLGYFGLISLKTQASQHPLSLEEFPAYGLLGVTGGLLGALYNAGFRYFSQYRSKTKAGKAVEVAVTSLFTSFVLYFATISLGVCSASYSDWDTESFELQFNCPSGNFNELASIIYGLKEHVIKEIILHPTRFSYLTLSTCFFVSFSLQLLTMGTAVPAGIFMPSIVSGCALGGVFGRAMYDMFQIDNPGSYAMLGAVAMLGGIQRTTISLCVIMMEGTGQTEYILPIIFTTVVANYIGNYFNIGIYELTLRLKNVPFLEHHVHHELNVFNVGQTMTSPVRTFYTLETIANISHTLSSCTHAGFPVVDPRTHKLKGLILREQLQSLLSSDLTNTQTNQSEASDRSAGSHRRYEAILESDLPEMAQNTPTDLIPLMNIAPHMVTADCPLSRAYTMFCFLGLRHLVVVDTNLNVVGMITRKDLLRVEEIITSNKMSFEQKKDAIARLHSDSSDVRSF